MKFKIVSLLAMLIFLLFSYTHASYSCRRDINNEGNVGSVITTQDHFNLNSDSNELVTLTNSFQFNDSTFFKYQYWADGGAGYHMIHFVGFSDKLGDNSDYQVVTLNLFCKLNESDFFDEPFF